MTIGILILLSMFFDLDENNERNFVGDGCLFKYGSYCVEGFTVIPSSDTIELRVTRR